MDLRQSPAWGRYLSKIGWQTIKVNQIKAYQKNIPIFNCSVIKIQRPQNPLPFSKFDKVAKNSRALFIILESQAPGYNPESLKKSGFEEAENMTFAHTATSRINLKPSLEKIFSAFSENARRNIKKAENKSLKIEKACPFENETKFQQFYELLQNLSKMKKFWIPDYLEYLHKMKAFKKDSLLLLAYKNQKPVAALWLLFFDNIAWYTQTGASQEGYELLANYLLVWEAVKVCKKMGLSYLDFEGIYDPRFPKQRTRWKNFTEFKKRFHGETLEYPTPWIKCYNLPFKLLFIISKFFGL